MFANVTFARFLIGQNMAIAQLAVAHVEIKNQKGVSNMSIYKKGDKYQVNVRSMSNGISKQKRVTCKTLKEAQKHIDGRMSHYDEEKWGYVKSEIISRR